MSDDRLDDQGNGEQGADDAAVTAAMTRSEEHLAVSTVREPVATARLTKFVVTAERTITVPVSREDVRLTYGPPPAPGRVGVPSQSVGPTVTLYAEEITVTTRWVPVETATLTTVTIATDQTVADTVRTEHITPCQVGGTTLVTAGQCRSATHQQPDPNAGVG